MIQRRRGEEPVLTSEACGRREVNSVARSLSLHLCVSEDTGSERRQSLECMSTGMTQHLSFPCGQRGRRCTKTELKADSSNLKTAGSKLMQHLTFVLLHHHTRLRNAAISRYGNLQNQANAPDHHSTVGNMQIVLVLLPSNS